MLKEGFHTKLERRNTNSMKWDQAEVLFGEKDLLPLWVADMDFKVAQPILDAIHKTTEHGIFGYPGKSDQVYEAVADWNRKRHQWGVQKEWLHFLPGVVPALSAAINTFTKPGDKVLVQSPVYPPFYSMVKENGRTLVNNPLQLQSEHYAIDFADFEKKLVDEDVKLFILCNPHNPVGRVWKKEELLRLANLCLANDVLIVSDEIHSDLIYREHKHIPLASLSDEIADITITCNAPSKTFNLAGLQSSFVIISNEERRNAFKKYMTTLGISFINTFGLAATEAAYRHGEEWLEALIDYLADNLTFLKDFISSRIPSIKVIEPEGTYLVWLDFREIGLEGKELEQFAVKKAKVALNEGHHFGEGGEGFKRMNIACPRETLQEALQRIEQAVNQLN